MTTSEHGSASATSKLSFWAIVVIAANTMNGPGLTTLPAVASAAGQMLFAMLVIVAAFVTSFVVRRLCNVMWKVNSADLSHGGGPRLQDTDIVALTHRFFQRKKLAAWAMVGCALSLALAQMMLCAAIADSMLVASTGKSCGAAFPFNFHCTSNLSMKPFQASDSSSPAAPVSMISAGLLISTSITVSLASVDLDSMLTAQYVLFGCLLVACARFVSTLDSMGGAHTDQAMPKPPELSFQLEEVISMESTEKILAPKWIGARPFDAVGPVLFNYAFVVTAPPLVCGASYREIAMRALGMACTIMGTLYTLIGWVGAHAAAQTRDGMDNNLLSLVLRGSNPESLEPLDVFSVILFGLSQLAAIPVYCELARETLLSHLQMQNKRKAFLMSHVLPWAIVAMTYNSALFEAFVEWSSLLLLGFSNFSLPLLLDQQMFLETAKDHHRRPGTGPHSVVWGFSLITASIAAVIVQRITESVVLAEGTFMVTSLLIFQHAE